MSTAPYWLTAATALVSALTGGAIGAWSSHRVMRSSQAHDRAERRRHDRQVAGSKIIAALLDARTAALDVTGARVETAEAVASLATLKSVIAANIAVLDGCEVDLRLSRAVEALQVLDSSAELLDVDDPTRTAVCMRFHVDRRQYVTWVIESMQDVAADDPAPPEEPDIPGLDAVDAAPWQPGTGVRALTQRQRIRRVFSSATDR